MIFKSRFILIDDFFIAPNGNLSVNRIIIRIRNNMRRSFNISKKEKIRIIKISPHLIIIIIRLRKTRTL
jgi:hypothetical protein